MFLGPNHPLTTTFELNFEAAKKKINKIPTNFRKKISLKDKVQVNFSNQKKMESSKGINESNRIASNIYMKVLSPQRV